MKQRDLIEATAFSWDNDPTKNHRLGLFSLEIAHKLARPSVKMAR